MRSLLRLKLALVAGPLRGNPTRMLGLAAAVIVTVPSAIGIAAAFAFIGVVSPPQIAAAAVTLGFGLLALGWGVVPLFGFGVDETLDVRKLALIPLPQAPLLVGLFIASALGVAPIATAIGLTGVAAGYATGVVGTVLVVAALALQFIGCIVLARVTTTVCARRLASRRGREALFAMAAVPALLGGGFAALIQYAPRLFSDVSGPDDLAPLAGRVAGIAGLIPLAWAGRVVVLAGTAPLAALGWLTLLAAGVSALVWGWARSIEGAMTAEVSTVGGGDRAGIVPAVLAWLPRNRLGAVIAREFRYRLRLPQHRAALAGVVVMPTFVLWQVTQGQGESLGGAVVLLTAVGAYFEVAVAINAFGPDGAATLSTVLAGGFQRADLEGKHLGSAAVALPLLTGVALVLAAPADGWGYVVPTVSLAVCVLGIGYGAGALVSVHAPKPMPNAGTNPFAGAHGQNAGYIVAVTGVSVLTVVALLPPVGGLLAAIALAPALVTPVGLVAAGYGVWLWRLGLRRATRVLDARGPEVAEAVDPASMRSKKTTAPSVATAPVGGARTGT